MWTMEIIDIRVFNTHLFVSAKSILCILEELYRRGLVNFKEQKVT